MDSWGICAVVDTGRVAWLALQRNVACLGIAIQQAEHVVHDENQQLGTVTKGQVHSCWYVMLQRNMFES